MILALPGLEAHGCQRYLMSHFVYPEYYIIVLWSYKIANAFCHAGAPSEPSLCLPLDPRKETQKRKKIKIGTLEKRNHKFRHSRYEKNLYQCMPDWHALSACVSMYTEWC